MRWLEPAKLAKVRWWEYAIRFLMGGAISAAAAVAGHTLGGKVAGAMLAFPAILPASLTLVDEKEGTSAAAEEAKAAPFGGVGLAGFAAALWAAARPMGPWSLPAALAAWAAAAVGSFGLWNAVFSRSVLPDER